MRQAAAAALRLGKEWPDVSPHTEELAVLRVSKDMPLPDMMVRKSGQGGVGERLVEAEGGIEELNPWMMKKLREPPSLASREDDQGTCVVQKGQKSMDYLRQTLVLVGGREGSHCRACALTVIGTRLKITSVGSRVGTVTAPREGRSSATGGAERAVATSTGEIRTEPW